MSCISYQMEIQWRARYFWISCSVELMGAHKQESFKLYGRPIKELDAVAHLCNLCAAKLRQETQEFEPGLGNLGI